MFINHIIVFNVYTQNFTLKEINVCNRDRSLNKNFVHNSFQVHYFNFNNISKKNVVEILILL